MATIDYYAATVKGRTVDETLFRLGRYFTSWVEVRGAHGYKKCWLSEGVRIYHDGGAGMGIYVQISGEGCALLSASSQFDTWGSVFAEMQEFGFMANRIDVAYDDTAGILEFAELARATDAGEFTSRFRSIAKRETSESGEFTERTRYFGTVLSETSLCVYDKRLERLAKGLPDPGHWVRCELRFKAKAAAGFASWVIGNPDLIGSEAFLRSAVEFRIPSGDTHKDRQKIYSWWEEFLQEAAKLRVTSVKAVRTLAEHSKRFAFQHSATLAMLVLALCTGNIRGPWLDALICDGYARINGRQRSIVEEALGYFPDKHQIRACLERNERNDRCNHGNGLEGR